MESVMACSAELNQKVRKHGRVVKFSDRTGQGLIKASDNGALYWFDHRDCRTQVANDLPVLFTAHLITTECHKVAKEVDYDGSY